MDKWNKVDNVDDSLEAKEKANQAKNARIIVVTSLVGLTCFLIATSSTKHYFESKNKQNLKNETGIESAIVTTISSEEISVTPESNKEITSSDYEGLSVDYSSADTFYNDLKDNGLNTEFKNIDDVKKYIDFTCYFDCNYIGLELPNGIESREDFERITDSYYKACAKNKVKPELNILYNNYPYMQKIINAMEDKAYNLNNSKGNNYNEANIYYSELASDLCTTKGINTSKIANIPGIENIILLSQNYNHVGSAYLARKNEKTVNLKDYSSTLDVYGEDEQYICPDATYKEINKSLKPIIDEQMDNRLNNRNISR